MHSKCDLFPSSAIIGIIDRFAPRHALVESSVTPPQTGNASCFPENVIGPRQTLMKNPCKNTQKTLWMLQAFQEFLLCDRRPHSRSVTCTLYTTSGKASPQPLSLSILPTDHPPLVPEEHQRGFRHPNRWWANP